LNKQLTIFGELVAFEDIEPVSPTNCVGDTEPVSPTCRDDTNKQLTIFDALETIKNSKKVSPTNCVGDTENQALQRYLAKRHSKLKDPAVHISAYSPNGRKTKYFRLNYRDSSTRKPKSIHIPGGNITAKLAIDRVRELQDMIDRGAAQAEIIAAVQDYTGGGK